VLAIMGICPLDGHQDDPETAKSITECNCQSPTATHETADRCGDTTAAFAHPIRAGAVVLRGRWRASGDSPGQAGQVCRACPAFS
jgi:hypothetical protein